MAKELEPQDAPFEIPEFNEDEFVRKELISFRTTIVLFAVTLVVALLTFFLWRATALPFLALVAVAMSLALALKLIFRAAKMDVSHWKRKEWIGTLALYFFFWLGFTLILFNPPLSDNAAPVIETTATPPVQGVGFPIQFAAYVGDNKEVDESQLRFCVTADTSASRYDDLPESVKATGCGGAWQRIAGTNVWVYNWVPTQEGTYDFFVRAVDVGGRLSQHNGTVRVGNPFPVIAPRNGFTFEDPGQTVTVRLDPLFSRQNVLTVRYEIDGRTYNMTPPTASEPDYWTTKPTFPGFKTGDNRVAFSVREQPTYLHGYKVEGGIARHKDAERNFTVAADFPDLARNAQPTPAERPPPNLAGTPGFEAVFLVAAVLVALVFAGRRSRRHG